VSTFTLSEELPVLHAKTVLLAEDHEDIRLLLKYRLENIGYKVITAVDGIEAVEMARRFEPSLIFMDINMPRMNGVDAAMEIREIPSLKETRIIAVTALRPSQIENNSEEAPFDRWIDKSDVFDQLAEFA
jgi:CheY-like chemotaxis protein